MGFLGGPEAWKSEALSTPEELAEAGQIVKKIKDVARFGYQIPAYSLARVSESGTKSLGIFAGLVFPGTQNDTSSVWGTIAWLEKNWGKDIKSIFPGVDFSTWFSGLFNSSSINFRQTPNDNTQHIRIFRNYLKNPQGTVAVLGMPAIDTQFYGLPPYSQTSGRPSNSFTYINFDTPESKELYEESLLNSETPLRLQNAIHSVLFSPDITSSLVGMNNSEGFNFVVKDGKPQEKYYFNPDSALNDFAGLGFDYHKSAEAGANNKPLIV